MSQEQTFADIYRPQTTQSVAQSQQEPETQQKSQVELDMAPSKIQQLISEVFRIGLCRNDDYNLAISSIIKKNKNKSENKEKLISDLKNREEDRQIRENEILKELSFVNKSYSSVEKHLKKMIRKALLLTVDPNTIAQKEQAQLLLSQKAPSYLHLAAIMNERTQEEKHTFGKIDLDEIKTGKKAASQGFFTEDKIDNLIDTYVTALKQPYELIVKTVERSRERFVREYAKLEATFEQSKFFSEQGVKDRKEKVKLKVLMNNVYGNSNVVENKNKGQEIFSNIPYEEQALRILQIHNSKIQKILSNYRQGYEERKQGGDENNTTIEDNKKSATDDKSVKTENSKRPPVKKPKFKPAKKEVEVIIKMKGNDGAVISYDEKSSQKSQSSSRSEKENIDDQVDIGKAKKKGTKKKPIKTKAQSSKFQSEETLEMLKNVLSKPKKKVKKMNSAANEEEKESTLSKKPTEKDKKKKTVIKKKPTDTMTRFVDQYGDTPFLQAIEDSYLKYLEHQYAKEAHLKALKKFQIMHALKTIQRFWKKKYQQIRLYCATMIQRQAKKFLLYLKFRNQRLYRIRNNLLFIKLKRQLILYMKKRRIDRSKIRQNINSLVKLPIVLKIQGLIRIHLAQKQAKFRNLIKKLTFKQKMIKALRLDQEFHKLIRDKETYFVQRYALAKCEVDSIMKYIAKAEEKFEGNWSGYEQQLEKYLVQNKQYKDWVQKKDDVGNYHWINLKTLKAQVEHPGKQIFQTNKKILKAKAEEELRENFKPIYDRRMKILETIFDIKSKLAQEFKKQRSEVVFKPYVEQETH